MLNVTVEKISSVLTFKCSGRLVRGDETTILCAAIHQQERELNLDLSEVTAIDAGGIGALVSLQAAGLYLRLINPTPPVREVLRLTKLDSLFEVLATEPSNQSSASDLGLARSLESSYAV